MSSPVVVTYKAGGSSLPVGPQQPRGWHSLERDPEQQAALATIRKLAAEGMSSRAIAAAVKDRHGLAVSHVAVLGALKREAA